MPAGSQYSDFPPVFIILEAVLPHSPPKGTFLIDIFLEIYEVNLAENVPNVCEILVLA